MTLNQVNDAFARLGELEREAAAFRAMIQHGLQYHPPDEFNPHHRISNRHGDFLAEGETAVEAVEKALSIIGRGTS